MICVTVWCDGSDELRHAEIPQLYPGGIARYTAEYLREDTALEVRISAFQDAAYGLGDDLLQETDVLVMYSHFFNDQLPQDRLDAVCRRVREQGMGLVLLHSALWMNLTRQLVGPCGYAAYREIGEKERVWTVLPDHPIASGMPVSFEFQHSEMYQESAGFPRPDDVIFLSWYEGGEASRAGVTWTRGKGRIFYFSPGHAMYDVMQSAHYHQVVRNGVRWAAWEG